MGTFYLYFSFRLSRRTPRYRLTIDKEKGKEASLAMHPTLDALRTQVRALLERSI
jgi:hypothetical protein